MGGADSIGLVTRVDWARYSGDDVEAVLAMMVNRERPNSVRITPSRGDGGVDILDPRTPRGRDDDGVLQVERFTAPLSAGQKAQVLCSLDALVADPRWATLRGGVAAGHAVGPHAGGPRLAPERSTRRCTSS